MLLISKQSATDKSNSALMTSSRYISSYKEKELLHHLIDAALNNVPEAQYALALEYLNGIMLDKDSKKAVDLLERSKSYHKSAYELGRLLLEGKEISQNIEEAMALFKSASSSGNLDAALQLGILHKEAKENDEAIEYFLRVIGRHVQNDSFSKEKKAEAHFLLAEVYLENKQDFTNAQKYLVRAYKDYGDVRSANLLGKLFIDIDSKYVKKDYDLAYQYLSFASNNGGAESTFLLSAFYMQGLGNIQKDINKGLELLKKACNLGSVDAQYALAVRYLDKNFAQYDPNQSKSLLTHLANDGYVDAQLKLAQIYFEDGEDKEGWGWAEKARGSNDGAAYLYLGRKILNNCILYSKVNYWYKIRYFFGSENKYYCHDGTQLIEEAANEFKVNEAFELLIEVYMTGRYQNKKVAVVDTLKALEYVEKAELKLPVSHYYSAKIILDNPNASNQEIEDAKHKLLQALDSNHLEAMFYYSTLLIQGKHFQENVYKGMNILADAANMGHYESQYTLGKLFYDGKGPKNCQKAVLWLSKSVYHPYNPRVIAMQEIINEYTIPINIIDQNSFKDAYKKISLKLHPDKHQNLLVTKFGEKKLLSDFQKAQLLYNGEYDHDKLTEAPYHLHTDAEFFIGNMYYSGCVDLDEDLVKAKVWYQMAADRDNKEAKFQLYKIGKTVEEFEYDQHNYADKVFDDELIYRDVTIEYQEL